MPKWTAKEMLRQVEVHAYVCAGRGDTRSEWALIGDVAETCGFSDALDGLAKSTRAKFPQAVARGRAEWGRDKGIIARARAAAMLDEQVTA